MVANVVGISMPVICVKRWMIAGFVAPLPQMELLAATTILQNQTAMRVSGSGHTPSFGAIADVRVMYASPKVVSAWLVPSGTISSFITSTRWLPATSVLGKLQSRGPAMSAWFDLLEALSCSHCGIILRSMSRINVLPIDVAPSSISAMAMACPLTLPTNRWLISSMISAQVLRAELAPMRSNRYA